MIYKITLRLHTLQKKAYKEILNQKYGIYHQVITSFEIFSWDFYKKFQGNMIPKKKIIIEIMNSCENVSCGLKNGRLKHFYLNFDQM